MVIAVPKPPLQGRCPSAHTGAEGFSEHQNFTPQSKIGFEEPIFASMNYGMIATGNH